MAPQVESRDSEGSSAGGQEEGHHNQLAVKTLAGLGAVLSQLDTVARHPFPVAVLLRLAAVRPEGGVGSKEAQVAVG